MKPAKRLLSLIIVLVLASALLGGCETTPVKPSEPAGAESARQAYRVGDYTLAAERWEAAADQVAAGDPYLLRAADARLLADDDLAARQLITRIRRPALNRPDTAWLDLLQAEIALSDLDLEAAEFYLEAARGILRGSLANRYETSLSRLELIRSGPAARQLARAATMVQEMYGYQPSQALALLGVLEDVPATILTNHIRLDASRSNPMSEWLALALAQRETLTDGALLEAAAGEWAQQYPESAITETAFLDLGLRYRNRFRPPSRVAVLLPESGGFGNAGNAIRDGLLAAYFENPAGSQLNFYDSGSGPESAVSAYFQAVEDGAEWIIGPVRTQSVDAVAGLPGFNAPALLLNRPAVVDNTFPANELPRFSLSLSQQEEVTAIARRSLEAGYRRSLVLVPSNDWGERMLTAFSGEFTRSNGQITEIARYPVAQSDHSDLLRFLLKIDESIARKQSLQARLALPLSFEPARRDDFDMIFLAATPVQGRQIRPQLRFFDAIDKPVFATARIYTGEAEETPDQDLNGIMFPITPWQLEAARNRALPSLSSLKSGQLGALHAVGRDAWNLLPWLGLMQKDPGFYFPGATGTLAVADDGRVLREPEWAIFSRGRPVPAELPAPD